MVKKKGKSHIFVEDPVPNNESYHIMTTMQAQITNEFGCLTWIRGKN